MGRWGRGGQEGGHWPAPPPGSTETARCRRQDQPVRINNCVSSLLIRGNKIMTSKKNKETKMTYTCNYSMNSFQILAVDALIQGILE